VFGNSVSGTSTPKKRAKRCASFAHIKNQKIVGGHCGFDLFDVPVEDADSMVAIRKPIAKGRLNKRVIGQVRNGVQMRVRMFSACLDKRLKHGLNAVEPAIEFAHRQNHFGHWECVFVPPGDKVAKGGDPFDSKKLSALRA
jgi:hypothetical protein